MRVKSRNPPAENLGSRIDDVVRDEMRDVAGDREHEVMMFRCHDLDVRSKPMPKRLKLGECRAVCILLRRQDAPSPVEEFGKARFRA